ncbi:MAG: hypothetical protein ACI88L_000749 [Candidatus Paceibacteria bacterium]|jgi:hypothetical protein
MNKDKRLGGKEVLSRFIIVIMALLTLLVVSSAQAQDLSDCIIMERGDSSAIISLRKDCSFGSVDVYVSGQFGIVSSKVNVTKQSKGRILFIEKGFKLNYRHFADGKLTEYQETY